QFSDIAPSQDPWTEETSSFDNVFEGIDASLAMGDIDNDGRLEAVIGNRTGGLVFYETDLMSSSDEISYAKPTGQLHVYPNPAHDFVMIALEGDHLSNPVLELYDINGKLLQQHDLKEGANRLNRQGRTSGVYFYRVRDSHGVLSHGKLIWK
ncbi:MAG TPA: T9SS type A sorting domain-containing protein, partial [Saprospiraceae bacterium]|nr:T9SS type A sorting domain-containing protein [Saprospiraceae bacterium]